MKGGSIRGRLALAGRCLAVILLALGASGWLPHLVLTQAVVSSLLTMVAAPLSLLAADGLGSRRRWSVPAFPAIALMSVGTIAYQAPPVVAAIGEGGPLTLLALAGLFGMATLFWSVVMPPARLRGLPGAGYIVGGSLPISMPAMFIIMLPRDIYTAFHAAAAGPLVGVDDQVFSGFVMFAVVKITLFVAFSFIFMSAAAESAEGGGGEDDRGSRRVPPPLPGWVQGILSGGPTTEEPEPAVRAEPVGAGRS